MGTSVQRMHSSLWILIDSAACCMCVLYGRPHEMYTRMLFSAQSFSTVFVYILYFTSMQ